jgi:hypothetical protein
MRSGLHRFRRFVASVFVALPLAFTLAYFLLPSERVVVVSGLTDAEIRAIDAVGGSMERVTKETARRGSIQQGESRIDALGADQTLWRLPPRGGWAGLSMGDDVEALDARLGGAFRFERRPNRWAVQVFLAVLLIAALIGLLLNRPSGATPPAR